MCINSVGTFYNLRTFFYHRFLRRDDAGPLLTATISESSQRGFIARPLLIAGHGMLEIILLAVLDEWPIDPLIAWYSIIKIIA
jgi:hypothetical protein